MSLNFPSSRKRKQQQFQNFWRFWSNETYEFLRPGIELNCDHKSEEENFEQIENLKKLFWLGTGKKVHRVTSFERNLDWNNLNKKHWNTLAASKIEFSKDY